MHDPVYLEATPEPWQDLVTLDGWLERFAAWPLATMSTEGRALCSRYLAAYAPEVGRVPLRALTLEHVRALYYGLAEAGLNPVTRLHIHFVLAAALRTASQVGMLDRDPFEGFATEGASWHWLGL